jgi:hypothetical protein
VCHFNFVSHYQKDHMLSFFFAKIRMQTLINIYVRTVTLWSYAHTFFLCWQLRETKSKNLSTKFPHPQRCFKLGNPNPITSRPVLQPHHYDEYGVHSKHGDPAHLNMGHPFPTSHPVPSVIDPSARSPARRHQQIWKTENNKELITRNYRACRQRGDKVEKEKE